MEIISPFQLYLILQLDSFSTFLWMVVILLAILSVCSLINASITGDDYRMEQKDKDAYIQGWTKRCRNFGIACVLLLGLNALLPSTKVMAAVVIVPAIANSEVVQQEASELYQLAKSALADAVDLPAEPAVPVQEEE